MKLFSVSNRALPWLVAALFFVAFCISFVQGHRTRTRLEARLEQATHPLYHRHADVRQFMIRAALDGVGSPIVVVGDSITEMAPLPDSACGHRVINAGIGGAATSDFIQLLPILFDGRPRPYLVVVALGANDVGSGSLTSDFSSLLSQVSALTEKIIAVSNTADKDVVSQERSAADAMRVPFQEIKVTDLMFDRIHFSHEGYRQWIPAVFQAVSARCQGLTELAPK